MIQPCDTFYRNVEMIKKQKQCVSVWQWVRHAVLKRVVLVAVAFLIMRSDSTSRELTVMYGYQTSFSSLVCDRSISRFGAHGQRFLCEKHYTDDSLAMGRHV